jgi:hypothetical protein
MKRISLAGWLTGLFFGMMLTLNFTREAGAGSLIRLIAPKPGAVLSGEVTLQAVVASAEVSYVIFGVDDSRPHSTNSSPYQFRLNSEDLSNGPHQLFAEAYSRGGLLGRSAPIKITVRNYALPPQENKPLAADREEVKIEVQAPPAFHRGDALASAGDTPTASPRVAPLAGLAAEPRLSAAIISAPVAAPAGKASACQTAPPALAGSAAPAFLLNNEALSLEGLNFSRQDRLEAGFRKIMEASGWQVTWSAASKTGIAVAGKARLEVTLGSDKIVANGASYPLGETARLEQDRLITPLRPVCEAAGMTLTWEARTRTVRLISPYLALAAATADAGPAAPTAGQ